MRNTILSAGILFSVLIAGAEAADMNIDQVDKKFSTDSASIKVGDTISFNNKDDVKHNLNVIDPDDNADDKGVQDPGQTTKVTFSKAGEYQVRCRIHPRMKMTVDVK